MKGKNYSVQFKFFPLVESKAAFKRALGNLMKEGLVEQKDGNTYLK
jgi:predicted RNA-binding protein (virulence factor B family)